MMKKDCKEKIVVRKKKDSKYFEINDKRFEEDPFMVYCGKEKVKW